MLKTIAVKVIRVYQKTLSLDYGWLSKSFPDGYCKYYPTCSQYAVEAIEKNGFFVGAAMGCWRVLRCNPWSKGGQDKPKLIRMPDLLRKI